MAEQQRAGEKENNQNRCYPSNDQRSPWYLQRDPSFNSLPLNAHQKEQLNNVFRSSQVHVQQRGDLASAEPEYDVSHCTYLEAGTSDPDQMADDKAYYSARPGTPALPETSFSGVYRDVPHQVIDTEDLPLRGTTGRSSTSRLQQNRVPLDGYQQQTVPTPPPLGSLLASQLPGNVARVFDELVFDHHQQRLPGSPYVPSNVSQRNMRQSGSERPKQVFQLGQVQRPYVYSPMSDVERRSPLYNFNQLQHNMVRLKNEGDSGQRTETSDAAPGEEFLQDDEGNHDCRDLRHGPSHDSSSNLGQPSSLPASHLSDNAANTPAVSRPDTNNFSSLDASAYQGDWPMHKALWMSGPSSIGEKDSLSSLVRDDTESIMSFSSSTAIASARYSHSHQLGTKVEMVYSLLSMLGSSNRDDMSRTLLEMSSNRESCIAMRQSGCLPLLVQLLHGTEHDYLLSDQDPNTLRWALREARRRAGQALHNIVYAHPDDKRGRREARVLRLLEQIRDYSDYLRDIASGASDISKNENLELHPGPAIAALMKLSFDEEHRHAMCLLGGLQAIAELIQTDHEVHGNTNDQFCITVRRYAGMALTNLTFGDGTNKALLCSMKSFMQALVAQLHSPNEDLRQVTASVLRNLSWRADAASKQVLREVDAVVTLMKTAMVTSKESTLKSILSALWNLSAHCSMNKADICAIEGALEFLVSTLTYKSASKTLSIVENGGGILRNISSHIAVREDYRAVLRKHNCLQTLLRHLKSPSLTVVSNACGTLWNLSARCQQDQQALWEMGAVGMLRNLIHSKHKMISMGSAAALKNLLAARPPGMSTGLGSYLENGHQNSSSSQNSSPSLLVRKQRALEADIDQNLSETCDNIDSPKTSPTPSSGKKFLFENNGVTKPQYLPYLPGRMYHSINGHVTSPLLVPRSESRDSVGSTRSEPPHYKAQCERFRIFVNTNRLWPLDMKTVHEKPHEWKEKTNLDVDDESNIVLQLFKSLHSNSNAVNAAKPGHDLLESSYLKCSKPNDHRGPSDIPNGETSHFESRDMQLKNESTEGDESVHGYMNGRATPYNDNTDMNFSQNGKLVTIEENASFSRHPSINIHFEGSRANKYGMDPIHENVVLRKKPKSDVTPVSSVVKESKTDEGSVDQTPLAVSWCSSFSSLASCAIPSARSSWVSDNSRRTSSIISPSELPDSPTSEMKPHVSRFTDKAPDAESLGIPRPRPAWPSSVCHAATSDCESVNEVSSMSVTDVTSRMPEHPPTSLGDIISQNVIENNAEDGTAKPSTGEPAAAPERESCPSTESSSSIENEIPLKKQHPVAAPVTFGFPNNSCSSTQHNNSKLHSRVNSLSSSFSYMRSNIPVKSNNVRLTQSVLNVARPQVLSSCAVGPAITESVSHGIDIHSTMPYMAEMEQNQVCDDNDNLVLQNHEADVRDLPKVSSHVECKDHKQPAVKTSTGAESFKRYSYKLGASNVGMLNRETAAGSHNHLVPVPSVFEENLMSNSSARFESKPKTSIPQIVRPWHLAMDNEVHPRQLQIISQNLPVYKSAFSVHPTEKGEQMDSDVKLGGTNTANENFGPTEHSSASADSEVSSSEQLQEDDSGKQVRSKAKRNKFRRSAEISVSYRSSDEDKSSISETHAAAETNLPTRPSDNLHEDKLREKNKELLVMGNAIPDLLEGATCHADIFAKKGLEGWQTVAVGVKNNGSPKAMTDSMEIRKGAFMVAAELEEGVDDHTHSSASCFSDLDNIKPPSVMGEMSMTSSGLSDLLSNGNGNGKCYLNGKSAVDRRRSLKRIKKTNGAHRFVFKSVLQSRDLARSAEGSDKPCSGNGSVENLSMKSSGTSELLDNINPPSVMDDISMTNSCASLNSINSDILESRSQSLADPRSDSEMFQRLNAAASMVQVYSRELNNIMTGSMKSSYNSDNLDQVKPPSVFQDIAEVTVEDGTEVGSDAMMSDSELEEELPHDDEGSVPSTETVNSPLHLITRTEHIEGSTENLNSSFEGDSICNTERHQNVKRVSSLALGSQNINAIDMGSNVVKHAVHPSSRIVTAAKSTDDAQMKDDIIKSDETEKTKCNGDASPMPVRRGPRIVKPINRETIRQMQEKKSQEKPVRSNRNKAVTSRASQKTAGIRAGTICKPSSMTKRSAVVSTVRPTRTSALRASQSQKQADSRSGGSASPRSFLSKPPVSYRSNSRNARNVSTMSSGHDDKQASKCQIEEIPKPSPPVKQGTFTKDEPTQKISELPQGSSEKENCIPTSSMSQSQTYSMLPVQAAQQEKTTDEANKFEKSIPTALSSDKISGCKGTSDSGVKRSSSNYSIRKNTSSPPQRKDNEKACLKLSPSTQSFGGERDGEKSPGYSNSRSGNFSRTSLSSLSSSSLSLKRANSQKEVTSKISSIWKKSESSSSANSPVTDHSVAEKAIPATTRPRQTTKTSYSRSHVTSLSSQVSSTRSSAPPEKTKPEVNSTKKLNPVKQSSSNSHSSGAVPTSPVARKKGSVTGTRPLNQARATSFTSSRLQFSSVQSSASRLTQPNVLSHRNIVRPYKPACFSGESESAREASDLEQKEKPSETEQKASPVSAVVTPFNYVPSGCKQSEKHEQITDSTTVEHTGDDDSENSESVSGNGKKCLVTTV